MSLFHNILSQIQDKMSLETGKNEAVAALLSDILHTTVTSGQITIKDTTLRIQAAPTLKMAIKMQQQKIVEVLQSKGFNITVIQ